MITLRQLRGIVRALTDGFDVTSMSSLLISARGSALDRYADPGTREERFTFLVNKARLEGWIDKLMRAARDARPADKCLNDFLKEATVMNRPGVPQMEKLRDELITILDDAAPPDPVGRGDVRTVKWDSVLMDAFRRFIPTQSQCDPDDFQPHHTAAVVVYKLSDVLLEKGKVALIDLAIHFAASIENREIASRLREWIEKAFDAMGIDHETRDATETRVRTGQGPHELYLQLRVERNTRAIGDSSDVTYDVATWRQTVDVATRKKEETPHVLFSGCTKQQMESLVERLLLDLEVGGARQRAQSFCIEIFLDHDTLALDADQWVASVPLPMTIGGNAPLVLRSWERSFAQMGQTIVRTWTNLWKEYQKYQKQQQEQPRVFRCGADHFNPKTYQSFVQLNSVTCMIVDFVPEERDYGSDGPLCLIVKSPTPIAIWARPDLPEEERAAFDSFLDRLPTHKDWREPVTTERLAAGATDPQIHHFGRHLCLLYDDPTRIPTNDILG